MRRVTVVGAGAAGLCAAFAAAKAGAAVTVVEGGDRIGGTTALSGGNGWFPANRHVPDDTPEPWLERLRNLEADVRMGLDRGAVEEAWTNFDATYGDPVPPKGVLRIVKDLVDTRLGQLTA